MVPKILAISGWSDQYPRRTWLTAKPTLIFSDYLVNGHANELLLAEVGINRMNLKGIARENSQ